MTGALAEARERAVSHAAVGTGTRGTRIPTIRITRIMTMETRMITVAMAASKPTIHNTALEKNRGYILFIQQS